MSAAASVVTATLLSIVTFAAIGGVHHTSHAFSTQLPPQHHFGVTLSSPISKQQKQYSPYPLFSTKTPSSSSNTYQKLPESDTPIAFFDTTKTTSPNFIECFIDSIATLNGVEYTIGAPCDHSVALCYFTEDDQLVPVELDDDELMDEIFPVAEGIVEDEFGEELVLQRTPQTLTLVGELEEGEDEEEDEYELAGYKGEEEEEEGEEEVEILLSFDHNDQEFHLVRLLDPVLLVGKAHPDGGSQRVLLTPEESDMVMPELEDMFMAYQDDN